jgi:hypothetical protein
MLLIFSQSGQAARKYPLTLKVVWSTTYDDNILKYSHRDVSLFENHEDAFPSEIKTIDDWVNTFGINAYGDLSLGHRFTLRPRYFGKVNLYAVNSLKNYSSHLFSLRLGYRKSLYLTAEYFYMPGYYLRMYKDRDWGNYYDCDLNLYRPSISLQYQRSRYSVEVDYGREMTYYNQYFTEFDSEADQYGIKGTYSFDNGASIGLGYQYKLSDNIGSKPPASVQTSNPTESNSASDLSFQENRYSVQMSYPLPIDSEWNWHADLNFQHRQRYYQTNYNTQQDPVHAGREDRRDFITTDIAFSPTVQLDLKFSFTFDIRMTDSPQQTVPAAKDFDHHTLDLTLTYRLF